MATRRKLRVQYDDRANNLSDEALTCRSLGHKWEIKAQSGRRFHELYAQGLVEYERFCGHGCGSTWRQVWDLRRKEMVENERSYPKGGEYLMPTGTGRMARGEAVVAAFARQHPSFA